jgi:hypothetical protein
MRSRGKRNLIGKPTIDDFSSEASAAQL